jgi:type VI secretion system secreted protein Hcp
VVAVKSIDWSGSDGDDVPKESVIFEFGAIRITYTPQSADGTLLTAKKKQAQWDRVRNVGKFPGTG